ncbi:MAG: bifunctional helix-turn-helix domain-containing protein/methylated-DNA--[protein]-cysteine S-methyltransferase [Neomegalonema sp.]|nr:bifunctional helix-turn-helix domain-containing protein/methylated-DNA--[protein]-cysteine S-methyltransferase [Neomegalonema sp.]
MHRTQEQYEVIAAAIRYLEENCAEHPDLETIAAKIGYSPTHFQRAFSQWVGVSPKKYLGYLTLDHAKRLLAERHSLLETSLELGLSSPSRLHDLFLSWEAMSPGVYASGGAGLEIAYGWFDTPFGEALAMGTEAGLCGLGFASGTGREGALADLSGRWRNAEFREDPQRLAPLVNAAFGQGGQARLALIGAPFQIKVWEALLSIPSGYVTTYSDIAARIGQPKAVRAVGTAVGRNPISWLIPCHRALRKSGALGGYHWGLPVKRAMLAYESARLEADEVSAATPSASKAENVEH